MATVFQNEGLDLGARMLQGSDPIQTLKVVLFTDNTAPADTDTYATHTPIAISGGAAFAFIAANWARLTSGGDCVCTYPTITWTLAANAGGVTVYGWMVYWQYSATNYSYFCDLLPTPFAVPSAGGAVSLDLTYHFKQC